MVFLSIGINYFVPVNDVEITINSHKSIGFGGIGNNKTKAFASHLICEDDNGNTWEAEKAIIYKIGEGMYKIIAKEVRNFLDD